MDEFWHNLHYALSGPWHLVKKQDGRVEAGSEFMTLQGETGECCGVLLLTLNPTNLSRNMCCRLLARPSSAKRLSICMSVSACDEFHVRHAACQARLGGSDTTYELAKSYK